MGIYPDPVIRQRRPKMKSVAMFFIAIARMRYVLCEMKSNDRRLKEDWAEHRKGGKELKESLRRLKGRRGILL